MNSDFYKVKEEEYEKYFDEKFTEKAINFIKKIQKEVINILKDKNMLTNSVVHNVV